MEGSGEAVDRTLLNHLLKMFTGLGIYAESFEKKLLECASEFNAAEGMKYMLQSDAPDYLKHVETRLQEELERCLIYLDASTRKPLIATAEKQLLERHIPAILGKLYEYQFNMGLLLVEKKDWNSKYIELSQNLVEVKDALEREKATHLIALSKAEKGEENLRKALGVEKECVFDLEKVLREMRSENANIKFTAYSKLAEANALIATIEEKSLEVEAKLRSADAKFAEISRKTSEIDRKSQDLEAQESTLRRERLSFIAEQKEKDLEEAHNNIDVTNETLTGKEDDVNIRIANITL
ncbi:Cullin, N-terminal [Sesbania bispinosa]|nr:Cullin, N-terminal [Sesbania bispinosa]